MTLAPGTVLDRYSIDSVLGAGGFGVTYRATDVTTGELVALKENFPSYLVTRDAAGNVVAAPHEKEEFAWTMKNFIKEARILARLSHPGVVRVYRAFETRGTAYFAMEFLDADGLDGFLPPRRRWKGEELASLLVGLLDALGHIHRAGVFHRDIKPANIMMRRADFRPVLIDFGAAKLESALGSRSRGFESRGYSAPEQLAEDGCVGPWTDIYSLGATLYCLLTGDPPSSSSARLFRDDYRPLASRLRLASSCPESLLSGIDRALSLDPSARFRSAADWLAEMGSPSGGRAASAPGVRSLLERARGDEESAGGVAPEGYSPARDGFFRGLFPGGGAVAFLRRLSVWCMAVGGLLLLAQFFSLLGSSTQTYLLDSLFPLALGAFLCGAGLRAACRVLSPPPEEDETS